MKPQFCRNREDSDYQVTDPRSEVMIARGRKFVKVNDDKSPDGDKDDKVLKMQFNKPKWLRSRD